jgi:hypothetical protein
MGYLAAALGQSDLMFEYFGKRHDLAAELVEREPENASYLVGLCQSHLVLGGPSKERGWSLEHLSAAASIAEKLYRVDQNNGQYADLYFRALNGLGGHATANNLGNAGDYWRPAAVIASRLYAAEPSSQSYRKTYAVSCFNLGQLARQGGDALTAQKELESSLLLFEQLAAENKRDPDLGFGFGALRHLVGSISESGLATANPAATLAVMRRCLCFVPESGKGEWADVEAFLTESEKRLALLAGSEQ